MREMRCRADGGVAVKCYKSIVALMALIFPFLVIVFDFLFSAFLFAAQDPRQIPIAPLVGGCNSLPHPLSLD